MLSNPKTIEETDPELAEYIRKIANEELWIKIIGTHIYRCEPKTYPNEKRRILHEIDLDPDRNEPCICGSGKKFKKCCGASAAV